MESAEKPIIYLDWNVFNKLEHLDQLDQDQKTPYNFLSKLIRQREFIAPYSNAHINDLFRGYQKDPRYTPGHIANLSFYTDNLCLTQYWGESKVRWHFRNPLECLQATIEENDGAAASFSLLFADIGDSLAEMAFDLRKTILRLTPVPQAFKQLYAFNPIFNTIYPRTKTEMNHLALCEDIYEFSFKIKNDYTLYKHFRKFLIETKNKYPQYRNLCNSAENKIIGKPLSLTWDELWDETVPKYKTSTNAAYDKIMNLFTTTDLKGYRQDERFANLIDDALHCFYGAHCDHFITLDKRCYDKAKLVYQKLNIPTQVHTPWEFNIDQLRPYLFKKSN